MFAFAQAHKLVLGRSWKESRNVLECRDSRFLCLFGCGKVTTLKQCLRFESDKETNVAGRDELHHLVNRGTVSSDWAFRLKSRRRRVKATRHVLKMANSRLSLSFMANPSAQSTPRNLKYSRLCTFNLWLRRRWEAKERVERGSGNAKTFWHGTFAQGTKRREKRSRSRRQDEWGAWKHVFPIQTTKWHTSKHVKDQLDLIELESGRWGSCCWCLSLWSYESFPNQFRVARKFCFWGSWHFCATSRSSWDGGWRPESRFELKWEKVKLNSSLLTLMLS